MTATTIQHCEAEEDGGAIYSEKCTLKMNNCTIGGSNASYGNKAKSGGGVYITGGTVTTMTGGSIAWNTADTEGGGVYMSAIGDGDGGEFTMSGGKIEENSANYGGGICVGVKGTFKLMSGFIQSNKATNKTGGVVGFGGGVYVYGASIGNGKVIMNEGEISGNTAGFNGTTYNGNGGGVYSDAGGEFTMSGGEIKDNNANNGGGVYVNAQASGVGTFKMGGSATVTPSAGNEAGKNDVYLNHFGDDDWACIIVTAQLANTSEARLTMRDTGSVAGNGYYVTRVVVKGEGIYVSEGYQLDDDDALKFQVTPQAAQNWKVVKVPNSNTADLQHAP